MSYIEEYKIVPKESFKVIRNCSGCSAKTNYINTLKFRVNANGNRLDAWLIYQCENCKHTYNLSICRGQKATTIPKEEFKHFWENDEKLASEYGKNYEFFKRNKAEVKVSDIEYEIVRIVNADTCKSDSKPKKLTQAENSNWDSKQRILKIHNPYKLKIRAEKQIASVLGLSRSQVDKLIEQQEIHVESATSEYLLFGYFCNDQPFSCDSACS